MEIINSEYTGTGLVKILYIGKGLYIFKSWNLAESPQREIINYIVMHNITI
jgi:hypothetical protein